MFLERLSQISNRIDGALALSLVDQDGIPIESVSSKPDLDLEMLAAETVAQVKTMHASYSELASGSFQHCAVATAEITLMISSLSHGYFLLLILDRDASLGQARFELRRARLSLEPELA